MLAQLKHRISEHKHAVLIALVLFGVFLVLLLSWVLLHRETQPNAQSNIIDTNFGEMPYIAPCSVLPIAQLQSISKQALVPSNLYATEKYYEGDLPSPRNAATTPLVSRCTYATVSSNNKKSVTITVYQPRSEHDYAALLAATLPTAESIGSDTTSLRSRVGSESSKEVGAFINTLSSSAEAIKSYVQSKHTPPYGAIVPYNLSAKPSFGVHQEVAFLMLTKYGVVKLQFVASEDEKLFSELSAGELSSRLVLAKQLLAQAMTNTDREHVTAKPVGTVLGAASTPWKIAFLDPCKLLTDEVFEMATGGVLPNEYVNASSTSYNRDYNRQQNYRVGFEGNDCEKQFDATNFADGYAPTTQEQAYGTAGRARVLLTVLYGLDERQVRSRVEDLGKDGRPLQTNADQALRIDEHSFAFRSGSYLFQFETIPNRAGDTTLSDQAAVLITNAILAELPSK